MAEAGDVGEPRQVAQGQRLVGEQRARQQGERGVLGTRDGDSALESLAAANDDLIHRASLADARGRASGGGDCGAQGDVRRSEEHTSELPSLMRHSYAVFCLKKKTSNT